MTPFAFGWKDLHIQHTLESRGSEVILGGKGRWKSILSAHVCKLSGVAVPNLFRIKVLQKHESHETLRTKCHSQSQKSSKIQVVWLQAASINQQNGAGHHCPVEISFSALQTIQMGKTYRCLSWFLQRWSAHRKLHLPRWFPHIKPIYKGAGETSEWLQTTWASHRHTHAFHTGSWATANILEQGNNTKWTRKIRPSRWIHYNGEIWHPPTTWFQGKGAQ